MKLQKITTILALALAVASCCGEANQCSKSVKCCDENQKTMEKYQKKYTNADFYVDGKFDQAKGLEAMKDMFAFYDVPFTKFMEENIWVTDFGMGDFENVGMGGIFWVNDEEHGYFAHTIYLLPNQMIPEHAHMPTDKPAKFESWMVSKGWCYNFSEVGEATPNAPELPASHGPVKSKSFVRQNLGEIVHLKQIKTFHFLIAGDEGAIVEEWACYHDNDGLRFTNKSAAL